MREFEGSVYWIGTVTPLPTGTGLEDWLAWLKAARAVARADSVSRAVLASPRPVAHGGGAAEDPLQGSTTRLPPDTRLAANRED